MNVPYATTPPPGAMWILTTSDIPIAVTATPDHPSIRGHSVRSATRRIPGKYHDIVGAFGRTPLLKCLHNALFHDGVIDDGVGVMFTDDTSELLLHVLWYGPGFVDVLLGNLR